MELEVIVGRGGYTAVAAGIKVHSDTEKGAIQAFRREWNEEKTEPFSEQFDAWVRKIPADIQEPL